MMRKEVERLKEIQDEVFHKTALLLLNDLEKYGPEKVANDINIVSKGYTYVEPTDDAVRDYISKIIDNKL